MAEQQTERERLREYYAATAETRRAYAQEYRRRNAVAIAAKARERRKTPKEVARKALRNAVKNGRVIKPTACQRCGRECNPHGHHHDYAKPLDVEWLCAPCHAVEHREIASPAAQQPTETKR